MTSSSKLTRRREIIRSTALYLDELEVVEDAGSRGRLFSGTHLKTVLSPLFYWLLRNAPVAVSLFPVYLIAGFMRMLYWWRKNPLRLSCEYVCRLAETAGYQHQPARVYRQFLANVPTIAENYFRLYRHGIESVLDRVEIAVDDAAMMNALVQKHGGAILAVPHNLGSAFSALKMNRGFPLVLVARNPSTVARTKAALDIFARMEVKILMVRGGNPFELSRTLFSVLKSGKVIAATVDNVDRSEHRIVARIFGQQVGFPAWATRIAMRRKIPIVPSYFQSSGKQIRGVFGEPLITDDVGKMTQYYIEFFERNIFEDPASWAYLGDKRWRRVLRDANDGLEMERQSQVLANASSLSSIVKRRDQYDQTTHS